MKKIVIITPNFYPEQGACATRIHFLAKNLRKEGFDVQILTALPNYPTGKIFSDYQQQKFVQETIDHLSVKRYWIFASNSSNLFLRMLSMLSFSLSVLFALPFLKKYKADYVFVQSPPFFLVFSGFLLSKISKSKLILNFSDLWSQVLIDLGFISKNSLLAKTIISAENFAYRKAWLCLGQSDEIVEQIQKKQSNVVLYRTGVEGELFFPAKIETQKLPIKMVYMGLLGIAQGMYEFCKKLNFNDLGVELHIFGDGAQRKILEEYLAKNSKQGIFLHQSIPYHQVPQTLANYDSMLVVQKKVVYGNFPSKIYEGMAVGLPILLVGGGESANLIKKNKLGFVSEPNDFQDFKQNIERLQNLSLQEKQEISQKSLQLVSEQFDKKIQVARLLNFLKTNQTT